jgi:uncharacterized protein YecE (DUF72 family)
VRRDQLDVLPAAPPGDVRTLGVQHSGRVSLQSEDPQGDHARATLIDAGEVLERFLDESAPLAEKRTVLLVQLPPSFAYDAAVADAFFGALRERYDGQIVCEPRHASWFTPVVDASLRRLRVARIVADPAPVPEAATPGGWEGFVYVRLHGSPRTYYSAYDGTALDDYARRLRASAVPAWCIFDNTAFGEATPNALELQRLVRREKGGAVRR